MTDDASRPGLTRRLLRALIDLQLQIFFREVELTGVDAVPGDGPVMFVVNHPSALVDPGIILAVAPRPVSFLGKSTLFGIPVIGALIRSLDTIPVFRRQDASGAAVDNRETFTRARELLSRGGAIAIFPEGISHSGPKLAPLKTGAARIALGAALPELAIIPVGLNYEQKAIFRSDALVLFGAPVIVTSAPRELADDGEPDRAQVLALTDRLSTALAEVVLEAEQVEALRLAERVERLLAADDDERRLAERFALRRRLLEGYHALRRTHGDRLAALEARVREHERTLAALGLAPDAPLPREAAPGSLVPGALRSVAALLIPMPLALAGAALHYPAYRLVGVIASRLARGEDDMLATLKVLAATLLFPLSWALLAVAIGLLHGPGYAALSLVAAPAAGVIALRFFERFERLRGAARGLALWWGRRQLVARLHDERGWIRDEVAALGDLVAGDPARPV
ncbi:MAG: 1-acyl-sn-glycerol-3-phosphate acyltransferase [Myxococcales bacterium]|nr:1-acyl-sn-glycerol-3-phosphate acyltransferase [Myxococcales bacterium]